MFYLIAQITLCLLAAFLLGAIITWFFMRGVRDRATQEGQAQAVARTSKLETELTAAREGMGRYRDRSQALEKDLASLRERMEAVRRDFEKGPPSSGADGGRVKDLEANLAREKQAGAANAKRVADLEAEATKLRKETDKAADAAKNAAARAGELEALVNSQKGKLASLEDEVAGLADLRRDLHSANALLRGKDERIVALEKDQKTVRTATETDSTWKDKAAKLESNLHDRDFRVNVLTADLRKAREDYTAALRRKDEEIAGLRSKRADEQRPIEKPRQKARAKPTPKKRDDLKRIKGIGVVLERLLHKNGVYTFQQIADWTREDVDRVDAKLGNFKGRIRRDHWIPQAKKLRKG